MNLKSSILPVIALVAIPFASQAHAGDAAVDACVKSFADAYLAGRPVRKVRKHAPVATAIESYYAPRQYTVALSAHGVRSGDLIAQARCVASKSGVVIVLDNPPADAYMARADFVASLR